MSAYLAMIGHSATQAAYRYGRNAIEMARPAILPIITAIAAKSFFNFSHQSTWRTSLCMATGIGEIAIITNDFRKNGFPKENIAAILGGGLGTLPYICSSCSHLFVNTSLLMIPIVTFCSGMLALAVPPEAAAICAPISQLGPNVQDWPSKNIPFLGTCVLLSATITNLLKRMTALAITQTAIAAPPLLHPVALQGPTRRAH